MAGRRRRRLRGSSGRPRRLVHRRLVRLDRHRATPTTSRTSRRRHARHRLRREHGRPRLHARRRRARPCSPAASSTRRGGAAAREARGVRRDDGRRDELQPRRRPAPSRSSRRSSSRGTTLYVGGSFSDARRRRARQPRRGRARGRRDDRGTRARTTSSTRSRSAPDGTVYVGGFFHTVNGNVSRATSLPRSTRPAPATGQERGTRAPQRAGLRDRGVGLDGLPRRRLRPRRRPAAGLASRRSTRPPERSRAGARPSPAPSTSSRSRARPSTRRLVPDRERQRHGLRQPRRVQRGGRRRRPAFSPMVGGDVFALGVERHRRSSSAAPSARPARRRARRRVRRDNLARARPDDRPGDELEPATRTAPSSRWPSRARRSTRAATSRAVNAGIGRAEPPGGVRHDASRPPTRAGTRT